MVPRENGAQEPLYPCLGSGGTRWPRFEVCPTGGPVPGSSEGWLSCGHLSVHRARDGCGRLAPLALGVLAWANLSFGWGWSLGLRLAYVAGGQSGVACTRMLWARAARDLQQVELAESQPWLPGLRPRRCWTTTSAKSLPNSFHRPSSGPCAPLVSASCASVGGGSCPVLCLGPLQREGPGSATSPEGSIPTVVPRVLTRPGSHLVSCVVFWTEAFAMKCSVSYNPIFPSA